MPAESGTAPAESGTAGTAPADSCRVPDPPFPALKRRGAATRIPRYKECLLGGGAMDGGGFKAEGGMAAPAAAAAEGTSSRL